MGLTNVLLFLYLDTCVAISEYVTYQYVFNGLKQTSLYGIRKSISDLIFRNMFDMVISGYTTCEIDKVPLPKYRI